MRTILILSILAATAAGTAADARHASHARGGASKHAAPRQMPKYGGGTMDGLSPQDRQMVAAYTHDAAGGAAIAATTPSHRGHHPY